MNLLVRLLLNMKLNTTNNTKSETQNPKKIQISKLKISNISFTFGFRVLCFLGILYYLDYGFILNP